MKAEVTLSSTGIPRLVLSPEDDVDRDFLDHLDAEGDDDFAVYLDVLEVERVLDDETDAPADVTRMVLGITDVTQ